MSPEGRTTADLIGEMVALDGGTFRMGSDQHYPEEGPVHWVRVDPFQIDRTPVTNGQFAAFVAKTGYVTVAEKAANASDYPDAPAELLQPASLVFTPPGRPVRLSDWRQWWAYVPGAQWRRPTGPGSSLEGLDDHPVVHVALADAKAYAAWAGKSLPTEAEWEYAARGGLDGAPYAWGQSFMPEGRPLANTWHGAFPNENLLIDGYARTSPVGAFPPNGYGLEDMIGNVWEWTLDVYTPRHPVADGAKVCCVASTRRDLEAEDRQGARGPMDRFPSQVLKGGSHLCAPNYCRRYRPAARSPQTADSSTSHIGFRCVRR